MAKHTLYTNLKYLKLIHILKIPRVYVTGHLVHLWAIGSANFSPVIGDAQAVEAAAEWQGEAGHLAAALVACGFIDVDDQGRHVIHDLWEHAGRYVRQKLEAAGYGPKCTEERKPNNSPGISQGGRGAGNINDPGGRGTENQELSRGEGYRKSARISQVGETCEFPRKEEITGTHAPLPKNQDAECAPNFGRHLPSTSNTKDPPNPRFSGGKTETLRKRGRPRKPSPTVAHFEAAAKLVEHYNRLTETANGQSEADRKAVAELLRDGQISPEAFSQVIETFARELKQLRRAPRYTPGAKSFVLSGRWRNVLQNSQEAARRRDWERLPTAEENMRIQAARREQLNAEWLAKKAAKPMLTPEQLAQAEDEELAKSVAIYRIWKDFEKMFMLPEEVSLHESREQSGLPIAEWEKANRDKQARLKADRLASFTPKERQCWDQGVTIWGRSRDQFLEWFAKSRGAIDALVAARCERLAAAPPQPTSETPKAQAAQHRAEREAYLAALPPEDQAVLQRLAELQAKEGAP